jgi:hypothetical protein
MVLNASRRLRKGLSHNVLDSSGTYQILTAQCCHRFVLFARSLIPPRVLAYDLVKMSQLEPYFDLLREGLLMYLSYKLRRDLASHHKIELHELSD